MTQLTLFAPAPSMRPRWRSAYRVARSWRERSCPAPVAAPWLSPHPLMVLAWRTVQLRGVPADRRYPCRPRRFHGPRPTEVLCLAGPMRGLPG